MNISYEDADSMSEETLRRWLLWHIKGKPEEERIKRENLGSKYDILLALVWTGAITSF